MKILAADTSTSTGAVALLDGIRVKAEWSLDSRVTHNRRLLGIIDRILNESGWNIGDIEGMGVTAGPGSFTGLRIGLTTIKTLAWARSIPFVAIHTLDALAEPLSGSRNPVCALLDARKKEVFAALYDPTGKDGLVRRGEGWVIPPGDLADLIREPTVFCGDGWFAYEKLFRQRLGEKAIEAPAPLHSIRAATVAAMARERILAGTQDDPRAARPFYLRPSDAELKYPQYANS